MSLLEAGLGASGAGILLSDPEPPEIRQDESKMLSKASGFGDDFGDMDLDEIMTDVDDFLGGEDDAFC